MLSTGVLSHVLDQHPGARFTVVCGPVPAGLFEGVPGLERIINMPKRRHSLHWWDMWTKCIGKFWDVVVDMRNAPLSYALLSKRQIHLGRAGKLDTLRVKAFASMVGREGNPPDPVLWTLPEHEAEADRILQDTGPFLALGPSANWLGKTWPAECFAELAKRLTGKDGILPGAKVAVIAHTSERDMAQPVLDALGEGTCINLIGETPLLTIFALLKRAAIYIGNDSGLMHMAAASGAPTLGLFGPSREKHYAPWGRNSRFVCGEKSYDEVFPEDYDYRAVQCLMYDLQVGQAEAAARELWKDVT